MALLEVFEISCQFGGLLAVDKVSFDCHKGEILAIIGPNGAGKTTIFNLISGFIPPSNGAVWYEEKKIDALPPHYLAKKGMIRTFQDARLFKNMTLMENCLVGMHCHNKATFIGISFRLRSAVKSEEPLLKRAFQILSRLGLEERAYEKAGEIPFGEQRLLELARAEAAQPQLLLLDEPAAGLNLMETKQLEHQIKRLNREDITIIIIEHDMRLIMSLAHRVIVINSGKKIAEGSPAQIQNNPLVIDAYLGVA